MSQRCADFKAEVQELKAKLSEQLKKPSQSAGDDRVAKRSKEKQKATQKRGKSPAAANKCNVSETKAKLRRQN